MVTNWSAPPASSIRFAVHRPKPARDDRVAARRQVLEALHEIGATRVVRHVQLPLQVRQRPSRPWKEDTWWCTPSPRAHAALRRWSAELQARAAPSPAPCSLGWTDRVPRCSAAVGRSRLPRLQCVRPSCTVSDLRSECTRPMRLLKHPGSARPDAMFARARTSARGGFSMPARGLRDPGGHREAVSRVANP
jgi:hypothetical protein